MTDLHTHILPGMDDGASDVNAALQLLEAEKAQGINAVALTPHFYRNRERTPDFLARRASAMARLREAWDAEKHPRLILAAEVAYMPGMADWEELDELCYENTRTLLVEPPQEPWNDEMLRQLYAIEGRRGITPMIAHLDRYFATQTKARIEALLETGFPIQVSAAALLQLGLRRKALRLLTDYNAVLVSDCHNLTTRPPDIGDASKVLMKKLGVNAREFCRMPASFFGDEDELQ